MTLPNERLRAIIYARDFLRSLLDPKQTPKIPRAIRREAYYRLKHFPGEFDLEGMLNENYLKLLEEYASTKEGR